MQSSLQESEAPVFLFLQVLRVFPFKPSTPTLEHPSNNISRFKPQKASESYPKYYPKSKYLVNLSEKRILKQSHSMNFFRQHCSDLSHVTFL